MRSGEETELDQVSKISASTWEALAYIYLDYYLVKYEKSGRLT